MAALKEKEDWRRHRDTAMGHELHRASTAVRRGRQLRQLQRPALSKPSPRQGGRAFTRNLSGKAETVEQGAARYGAQRDPPKLMGNPLWLFAPKQLFYVRRSREPLRSVTIK